MEMTLVAELYYHLASPFGLTVFCGIVGPSKTISHRFYSMNWLTASPSSLILSGITWSSG
jgi:hypothetical protein